jgi:hypothetical protein
MYQLSVQEHFRVVTARFEKSVDTPRVADLEGIDAVAYLDGPIECRADIVASSLQGVWAERRNVQELASINTLRRYETGEVSVIEHLHEPLVRRANVAAIRRWAYVHAQVPRNSRIGGVAPSS